MPIVNQGKHTVDVEYLLNSCNKDIDPLREGYKVQAINDYITITLRLFSNNTGYDIDKLKESEKQFEQEYGEEVRIIANRILVYRLYLDNFQKIDSLDLPEGVICYLKEDFSKIVKLASQDKKNFITFQDAQFYKYLKTLQFKLFPLGIQGIVISGFPRSLLWKSGLKNGLRFFLMLIRLGDNKPLFEMHFNPHRLRQFDAEGWNNVFSLAAKIMLRRTEIKGIFGGAWFFDPYIKDISPELSYIQNLIEKIGGEFFFARRTVEDRKNAFAMSASRRSAFEEGRYDPASYIAIVPRTALMQYYAL